LDTGSIADTTYHVFLIKRVDTGVVDALFSTSATTPTLPTNYTKQRRIGSILREGGAIVAFSQNGDEFLRAGSLAAKATSSGTSAVTRVMAGVPDGIVVNALIRMGIFSSASADSVLVTALSQPDEAPATTATPYLTAISGVTNTHDPQTISVRTDTSRQIRTRQSVGGATETLIMVVYGWIDTRGRLA